MGEPLSHPYLIYEAFPERYLDTMQDVQTTLLSWLKDGDEYAHEYTCIKCFFVKEFHQRMQLPTPKRNVILVYIVWDLLRCTTVGLPTAAYCLSLVSFPDSSREGSLNGTK